MSHTLYETKIQRVQRCELAVPGSRPEMFEKALKSGVDFIFLDLEDAVAPDDKIQARKISFRLSTILIGKAMVSRYQCASMVWIHNTWCVILWIWSNKLDTKSTPF